MRRFLAFVGLIMALAGFVLIFLSIRFNIPWFVPFGLILGSFLILLLCRNMPSPLDQKGEGEEEPKNENE